jgi:hypothetical protein
MSVQKINSIEKLEYIIDLFAVTITFLCLS